MGEGHIYLFSFPQSFCHFEEEVSSFANLPLYTLSAAKNLGLAAMPTLFSLSLFISSGCYSFIFNFFEYPKHI